MGSCGWETSMMDVDRIAINPTPLAARAKMEYLRPVGAGFMNSEHGCLNILPRSDLDTIPEQAGIRRCRKVELQGNPEPKVDALSHNRLAVVSMGSKAKASG